MTRFVDFERDERRRAGVSDAGHGFSPFLSDTDRKGGRLCRSLRCPVPQTRLRSTAGLEEPTYSVVGDLHNCQPRRRTMLIAWLILASTRFETTMSRNAGHRLLLPLYPRFEQRED